MLDQLLSSFTADDFPTTTLKLIEKLEEGFIQGFEDEPEEFKGIGSCFIEALKTHIAGSYVVKKNRPLEARSMYKTELFLLARELIAYNPFTPHADELIEASIDLSCTLDFTTLDRKTAAVVRHTADQENISTLVATLGHVEKGIVRVCAPMESYGKRDFRTLCKGLHSFITDHEGKTAAYYHLRAAENLLSQRLSGQRISQEEASCYQHLQKHFRFAPFEELHKLSEDRLKRLRTTIREHARVQRGGQRMRITGTSELITFLNEKADPIFSRAEYPSLITTFEEYLTGTVSSEYIKEWLLHGASYA